MNKNLLCAMAAVAMQSVFASLYQTEMDMLHGLIWTFTIREGNASIGAYPYKPTAISSTTTGDITIPSTLSDCPVVDIGYGAFSCCSGLTSVKIPSGVTSIGKEAFRGCNGLKKVSIPSSVTNIAGSAFYECIGLTSVTIPSQMTSIGEYTFYGCSGLTSLTIPSKVTSIGERAFSGCSGLKNVTIPSGVTHIGDFAFYGCSGLTSVTIPSSVISIGAGAFDGCSGLGSGVIIIDGCVLTVRGGCPQSVVLPQGTRLISRAAFESCSGLRTVTIPSSVTRIEDGAFWGCSGLTSVVIPSSVSSISVRAFYGCRGLTSVTIPSSVKGIGSYAFYGCSGLTSVTIPSSVTSIGYEAFYGCSGLTSVDFEGLPPEGLASACINKDAVIRYNAACQEQWLPVIKECGFTNATPYWPPYSEEVDGVTWTFTVKNGGAFIGVGEKVAIPTATGGDVIVPDRLGGCPVVQIQSYAFSGCTAITNIVFPSTLTNVQKRAFNNCTELRSVEFPASLQYLDNSVFRRLENVTNVTFLGNAPVVDDSTFKSPSPYFTVTVKCGTLGWDDDRDGYWKYRKLRIEDGGPYTEEVDGVAWTFTVKDGGAFVGVGGCAAAPTSVAGDVVVPSYLGYTPVVQIQSYAFSGCSSITNVVFPSTLTNVQKRAFNGCYALRSVDFPAALQYLDNSVFRYLENVTNVTFLGDAPVVDDSSFKSPSPYFTVTVKWGASGWDDDGDGRWKYREIRYAADFMSSQYNAALDVGGIVFDAVDPRQWKVDATISHYNGSSIRTAGIGRDGKTFIQTRIVGPKRISFWWAVSSEKDYDVLSFLVDGVEMTSISGVGMTWQNYEMLVGEGMHVIQWKYSKDDEDSDGEDCGWIDCLNIMEPLPEVVENGTSLEYIPEQLETSLVLPNDWLIARGLSKEGDAVSDVLAKMSEAGKNGIPRYQSYVLGMEPDSDVPAEEQLKVTISGFDKDGSPIIEYEPTPNDASHVTVKKLGVKTLGGDWEEVPIGKEADYNFFKVTVEVR